MDTNYKVYTSTNVMTGTKVTFYDSIDLLRRLVDVKNIRFWGYRKYTEGDAQIERNTDGSFYVYLPEDEYDIQQLADIIDLIDKMDE